MSKNSKLGLIKASGVGLKSTHININIRIHSYSEKSLNQSKRMNTLNVRFKKHKNVFLEMLQPPKRSFFIDDWIVFDLFETDKWWTMNH